MHAFESYTVKNIDKKQSRNAYYKITAELTIWISVYKRQIYQIAESNRKNRVGSENRIKTFFARIGMLYSVAEGPGFKSQLRRCRVLGKLFTSIVPLFIKQQNW